MLATPWLGHPMLTDTLVFKPQFPYVENGASLGGGTKTEWDHNGCEAEKQKVGVLDQRAWDPAQLFAFGWPSADGLTLLILAFPSWKMGQGRVGGICQWKESSGFKVTRSPAVWHFLAGWPHHSGLQFLLYKEWGNTLDPTHPQLRWPWPPKISVCLSSSVSVSVFFYLSVSFFVLVSLHPCLSVFCLSTLVFFFFCLSVSFCFLFLWICLP